MLTVNNSAAGSRRTFRRSRLTLASTPCLVSLESGSTDPRGSVRIAMSTPPGAFADVMLKAGRWSLACRKEGEEMDADVAFARDIRPLFSNRDVRSMSRFFDLSSYDDVRANAEGIYRRLADGTMPCYGPWPADNVQRFRTWIDNGFAP
jgi:hypothetical protein